MFNCKPRKYHRVLTQLRKLIRVLYEDCQWQREQREILNQWVETQAKEIKSLQEKLAQRHFEVTVRQAGEEEK